MNWRQRRRVSSHSMRNGSSPEDPSPGFCGSCGAMVASPAGAGRPQYCHQCGARLAGSAGTESGKPPDKDQSDPLIALIGQAAAVVAVAVALLYGAGALDLALRLAFTHLSWDAVLGQLPRDFIIMTGFGQVILPAIILGTMGGIFINFLVNGERRKNRTQRAIREYLIEPPGPKHFLLWVIIAVVLGLAEALIALPWYIYYERRYTHHSVLIPPVGAFVIVAILSIIAVGLALILLPKPLTIAAADMPNPKRSLKLRVWQWTAWVGILVGFAALPGIAAIAADRLFPRVVLCSPVFKNEYMSGNLIATNGGWAYTVEYHTSDYSRDFIAAIPLSSVHLEAVGKFGVCSDLNSRPGSPTPSPSPSAKP